MALPSAEGPSWSSARPLGGSPGGSGARPFASTCYQEAAAQTTRPRSIEISTWKLELCSRCLTLCPRLLWPPCCCGSRLPNPLPSSHTSGRSGSRACRQLQACTLQGLRSPRNCTAALQVGGRRRPTASPQHPIHTYPYRPPSQLLPTPSLLRAQAPRPQPSQTLLKGSPEQLAAFEHVRPE